jgi:hypothetical protein
MPEIEIGINKGKTAILKVIEEGWDEQPELIDTYKSIGSAYISPKYEVVPGEIDKKYLLEILSKQETDIQRIKKLLV